MRKGLIAVAMAVISIFLLSCQEDGKGTTMWGVTEYYTDFLWRKYEPVRMLQNLEFDFNEDAQRLLADEIFTFEVVELDEKGSVVPNQFIVYKDGAKCNDNIFTVTTNDIEVCLAMEFFADAREGNHKVYIREKGKSGLSRVDYTELTQGVFIKKVNKMNPLAKGSVWGGSILLVILVVWFIASRLVFWPAVRFSRVEIDYKDGFGFRRIRTSGCYELVLTNDKTKRDSFFAKMFKGSRCYEVNAFWTAPVIIMNGTGKNIRVSSERRVFLSTPLRPMRRDEFTLANPEGKSVTLRTN